MSQLKQVADEKVATKDVINQKDAAKIASAEAKLYDGQTPGNSVASKAQVHTQSCLCSFINGYTAVLRNSSLVSTWTDTL